MPHDAARRIYVAATSQNDGKTSLCLGLMSGLRTLPHTVGFIKPVGQRYVVVGEDQVDEDAVLIQRVCGDAGVHVALKDMNPVAVPQYFTRAYLDDPEAHYPGAGARHRGVVRTYRRRP